MSTHKHFDKICCVVLVLTLLLAVLFMNAGVLGVSAESNEMGYEDKLFDTSVVHTLDIVMDDWEEFTDNCQSEEYYDCTVIIDDETYRNVAIRGKGNTSLSQVSSYGNDRYSFKIEFDHYDSSNTYYGLDKLCLNNIIQDNTYMKDYLTYQMMGEMGVAAPLCSYVYITVNGEDWGLYLAVESVEDSFLKRNFGNDYGELYKPDSMSMGGGRGNGKQFDIEEFMNEFDSADLDVGEFQRPGGGMQGGQMPEFDRPSGGMQGGQMPEFDRPASDMQGGQMPEFDRPAGDMQGGQMPEFDRPAGDMQGGQIPNFGMPGGGMNFGSDDVLLKYIDDDTDSYSNIFDNAKTDITSSDKTRLVNALKKLSAGEKLSDTVDIETVIRYFVVHNFVLNFDSYTGGMIHNYYLYEQDGQMQMIPWDYNLAFGGFQSMGSATSLVNYPIDTPVSGGNTADRPMIAWIFENEEYTELYHTVFAEFISEYFDSGYFADMFQSVTEMIAPYVAKDPTKFCTYEEFEKAISTLREFCLLRAESINGQLNGSIGSTDSTQDDSTFVDAGSLQISDMGAMNHSMGGGRNFSDRNKTQAPDEMGNVAEGVPDFTNRTPAAGMRPDVNNRFNDSRFGATDYGLLAVSAGILMMGLIITISFKRRKEA